MALDDKFVVGYTSWGSSLDGFTQSLLGLYVSDAYGKRRIPGGQIFKALGPYPECNRQSIADEFLKRGKADWLVMIDVDHMFERDGIYALVDSSDVNERPVVSASYWGFWGKEPFIRLLWFDWSEDHGLQFVPPDPMPTEMREISAAGMGCCCMHRSVLQRLKDLQPNDTEPCFGQIPFIDPTDQKLKYYKEDIAFCLKARHAGFKVWGNPNVEVDHLKVGRQNRHTLDVRLKYDNKGATEITG